MIDAGLVAKLAESSNATLHNVSTLPNDHGTVDLKCSCGKTFAGQPWHPTVAKRLGWAHVASPKATTVQLLTFLVMPERL